jgi:hypothetical protein
MLKVKNVELVVSSTCSDFAEKVKNTINNMENKGLSVSIHYQMTDKNISALIVGKCEKKEIPELD